MLFYTFQNSQVLADMIDRDIETYIPNWAGLYSLTGSSKEAYDYLLKKFNEINHTQAESLVFGYSGWDYWDSSCIYTRWKNIGLPSGACWFRDPERMIGIFDIPDDTPMLRHDFYRFSDLLCDPKSKTFQEDLLKANTIKGFEFPVTNIPYLKREWLKETF